MVPAVLGQRESDQRIRTTGGVRGRTLLRLAAIFALALMATACAADRHMHTVAQTSDAASQAVAEPPSPEAVLVRVGRTRITQATVARYLSAEQSKLSADERLTPPDFSACVAHMRAESAAIAVAPPDEPQLRRECQTQYRESVQLLLGRLIADAWLIEGAREAGAPVSEAQAHASLARLRTQSFPSQASFRQFLAGRTVTDVLLEIKAKLAAASLHAAIAARAGSIPPAQVASYYHQHRFEYLTSGERDLGIVRTQTEAEALKAKAEIASGTSFASVAKKQSTRQPIDANEGLVSGLDPHFYGEPNLNEAIFTARPGVVMGPLDTWFGWFVFKVTGTGSEHEKPLARVQPSIREQLAKPLQERALASFTRRWQATWTTRTDCSAGDVVPGCRQFKGAPAASLQAPQMLD